MEIYFLGALVWYILPPTMGWPSTGEPWKRCNCCWRTGVGWPHVDTGHVLCQLWYSMAREDTHAQHVHQGWAQWYCSVQSEVCFPYYHWPSLKSTCYIKRFKHNFKCKAERAILDCTINVESCKFWTRNNEFDKLILIFKLDGYDINNIIYKPKRTEGSLTLAEVIYPGTGYRLANYTMLENVKNSTTGKFIIIIVIIFFK